MRPFLLWFPLLLAGLLTACHSTGTGHGSQRLPPLLPTGAAGISEEDSKHGRELYIAKCAKCHEYYHPSDYSKNDWNIWMQKMARKAKLKPEETDLVSRYLEAVRLFETAKP
jgi:hypothetical protein